MEKHEVIVSHDEDSFDTTLSPPVPPSDPVRTRRIVRSVDIRLLPLCAWIYLLNYLDRGNIGNARVLNSETHDSLVQATRITPTQYAIVLSLFSLAYAFFEVPSNWIMKRYVKPSIWLAVLLLGWGACTLGFTAVQNYGQVLGKSLIHIWTDTVPEHHRSEIFDWSLRSRLLSWNRLHHNLLVSS